jgi:membrane protease YdiL (CAAX protease family)
VEDNADQAAAVVGGRVTASSGLMGPQRGRRGCASSVGDKGGRVSHSDGKVTARSRLVSGIEFLLGAAVVVGHNVFHLLPNEVPILFVCGLLSARLRDGRWTALGLGRPASWARTLLIALAAAALRIVLGAIIEQVAERFWPPIAAPAGTEEITGNVQMALWWLLLVWTFAAFGEEIAYRGYLLRRAADLGKGSTAAYWVGIVAVSVLFGYGHYYKGPAGIVDSGVAGLVLGAAYMLSGRNLWASILAHGFIDTFGLVVVFFGWQS